MADTILILGNGFDIAMDRKTKYSDFIDFEKQLFSNPAEELLEFLKAKNISIEKYKDNLYLQFINENKDTLGENWSNIEIIISQLADAIMFFKENNVLYNENINEPNQRYLLGLKNRLLQGNNAYAKIFVVENFSKLFYEKDWRLLQREVALENLNNEFINQLDFLTELLEIYLSYLDYLDFEVNKIKPSPTALDEVPRLLSSYVLNFNYTNTSAYLFGTVEERTHFIHGRIDLDRTFNRINTMVFGVEDKENDVNSYLIPYQKYYQRVVKETGSKFEEFFKMNIELPDDVPDIRIASKNIVVFGHSVDPLDKEIFQKCFELATKGEYPYRFIFTYYD